MLAQGADRDIERPVRRARARGRNGSRVCDPPPGEGVPRLCDQSVRRRGLCGGSPSTFDTVGFSENVFSRIEVWRAFSPQDLPHESAEWTDETLVRIAARDIVGSSAYPAP